MVLHFVILWQVSSPASSEFKCVDLLLPFVESLAMLLRYDMAVLPHRPKCLYTRGWMDGWVCGLFSKSLSHSSCRDNATVQLTESANHVGDTEVYQKH